MIVKREIENLSIDNLDISMVTDCFGDKRIIEVVLSQGVLIPDLDKLSNVGNKTILEDLPRPFFRIDCPGKYLLTGIIGDRKLRFTLRRVVADKSREIVLQAISELYGIVFKGV